MNTSLENITNPEVLQKNYGKKYKCEKTQINIEVPERCKNRYIDGREDYVLASVIGCINLGALFYRPTLLFLR